MNFLINKTFASLAELHCAVEHVFGEDIPAAAEQIYAGTFQFITESGREIEAVVEGSENEMTVKYVFAD